MITIYSNELAISFNNIKKYDTEKLKNIQVTDVNEVKKVVDALRNDEYSCDINLFGYYANDIFEDFCTLYTKIEAAGGLVKNIKSEYLLIKRFGIWDLPKGKVEAGETMLKAAVREVCEETGLKNIATTISLPCTYHIYYQYERWFLKKTHWYLMETSEDTKLIPQADEDISEAVWLNKTDAFLALSDSYRSLYDTLGYLFKGGSQKTIIFTILKSDRL